MAWADTRQELCEGVPCFRSYQGGFIFIMTLRLDIFLMLLVRNEISLDRMSLYLVGKHSPKKGSDL